MAANAIRAVTFRPVTGPGGGPGEVSDGHAMFIALEIGEPDRLAGFLEEVVTRWKLERMAGPPDAWFMLITLIGDVPAATFAEVWRAVIAHDAPARALLGMLQLADVMQGDGHGGVLGQASLLAAAPGPVEPGARS